MMTRKHAKIYIFLGLTLAGFGFYESGPAVHNFWLWLTLPSLLVVGGIARLLRHK